MGNEFPYEEIRSLLFEYLSENQEGQFVSAVNGVIECAKEHGMYAGASSEVIRVGGPNWDLGPSDAQRVPEAVRQLFWQLLVQGIIVFGSDDANPNWPWYRVTEYGESILSQQGAQPYDPDGFIKEFKATNPAADAVILDYLQEAVRTFTLGCFKASAVMLGCASEHLILLLHEAFESAIQEPAAKKEFRNSYRWMVSSKFRSLRDGLESTIDKKKLPRDLVDVVRSDLISGFELIRRIRNAAGHPDIPSDIRRETVFIYLAFFPEYTRQVLRLVCHFQENEATP